MTTHQDESRTERELRAALGERAREIRPSSRLDAILAEAAGPEHDTASRRWWAVAAVAATAALVGGIVWAARPDGDGGTLPATPPPTTSVPGPTTSAPTPSPTPTPTSASPSVSPSATGSPGTTAPLSHGIYEVGHNGGADDRWGLVRSFWRADVAGSAPRDAQVRAAVGEALRRSPLWNRTTVVEADASSQRILLRLSGTGAPAPTRRDAELAVWSVVWTAQAALGRGDVPVRIVTDAGGPLLGQVPTSSSFTRAQTPADALCDIWVDDPAPGARVDAGRAVVVRGQAVAFEAALEWDLRRGATVLKDGFTTASIGAPARGTFSVDLGRLPAGSYTFRAFTTSAEDGSVFAERTVTFTVR